MSPVQVFAVVALLFAAEARPAEEVGQGRLSLVADGDSITSGEGSSPGRAWPHLVERLLGAHVDVKSFATPGATLTETLRARVQVVDDAVVRGAANVYIAWAGTNDIKALGLQGAVVFGAYRANMLERRAAGYRTVALTILPRWSMNTDTEFVEANRREFNELLRSRWTEFADALADVAGDSRIGDYGDQFDATYYADSVHLTDRGQAVVADIVAEAVRQMLQNARAGGTPVRKDKGKAAAGRS